MVNLSKENINKPLREYTPAHICDEYAPAPQHNSTNTPPAVEVVPQKQTLAAHANKAISYTQASADHRQEYLASTFQISSEAAMSQYGLLTIFQKIIKKCTSVTLLITILISLMCLSFIVGFVCEVIGSNNLGLALLETSLIFTLITLLANPQLTNMPTYVFRTIKRATDIYISHYGAYETDRKIMESPQRVECYIYKPIFCKDEKAFDAVTKDKHDVFILYSSKTQCAIVIDPKLFE